MENTVTLARQEREKQGPWEVEVSYGGEADLHQHFNDCKKNPDHHKFIPVEQFNIDHLPPGCQDDDLVDYVRALSDLTVRVSVEYISEDRPETVDGKPYPCYKERGNNMMRVGTGWVDRVFKHINDDEPNTTCSCQECQNLPTPKTQFAKIYINTAAHVVYDNQEAARTKCHLFFDKGDLPKYCSGAVTLTGFSVDWKNDGKDQCWMFHATHNLDLADQLDKMLFRFDNLKEIINYKFDEYQKQFYALKKVPNCMFKLAIIVSHPHGCSKQVSVGECCIMDMQDSTEKEYKLIKYKTPTCPGSSGACVYWSWGFGTSSHGVHCGNRESDENVNFCYHY